MLTDLFDGCVYLCKHEQICFFFKEDVRFEQVLVKRIHACAQPWNLKPDQKTLSLPSINSSKWNDNKNYIEVEGKLSSVKMGENNNRNYNNTVYFLKSSKLSKKIIKKLFFRNN